MGREVELAGLDLRYESYRMKSLAVEARYTPQDDLGTLLGPIGFKLALRGGKWDKQNRSSSGLPSGRRPHQDLVRKWSPFLLKKIPTGRE
jgi:hypothetical protein